MNNTRPITIQEMKQILEGTEAISFQATNKEEMYQWIETTLRDTHYLKLKKKQRGIVRHYIQKMTGLKKSQFTNLAARFKTKVSVRVKAHSNTRCWNKEHRACSVNVWAIG